MELSIDQTKATRELHASLKRCESNLVVACKVKDAIDFVLSGKGCLTYRYILLTALTAKATNEAVDILSLQAGDASPGAYDARSLCSHVVFPFQKDFLENILDGSNEDPLVNNPGRHPRLTRENKAQNGDPKRALNILCEELPKIETSDDARDALDYYLARCLAEMEKQREQAEMLSAAIISTDVFSARRFVNDLLDKNFGGTALLLVASAIFRMSNPPELGFEVVPHPVNQSGSSHRQMSDLDVFKDGKPFLAIELKDKPFTEIEVKKAAQQAYRANAPAMLFIAGRASTLSEDATRYFNDAKAKYETKGMVIGVLTIDALVDLFFATHYASDMPFVFTYIDETMDAVHASPEVMRWTIQHMEMQ